MTMAIKKKSAVEVPLKLRLILDVTYQPNGLDKHELGSYLKGICHNAASSGQLTQSSGAEVLSWNERVIEGHPP